MAETVQPRIFGVAEISYYLKEYLAEDPLLQEILIRGELSGFKAHSSGHLYFSLKEEPALLKCVMFRNHAQNLSFQPQNGQQVVAFGSLALYERDGSCQLYVRELFAAGAGEAAQALAALRERLAAEGLFSPLRKKPLPPFPQSIGVITAPKSAAWADLQKVAYARWPQLRLQLYPAAVQGEKAAAELAAAIAAADQGGHQLLILGRGGGAAEDLAAFNAEAVVRAVAEAATPIISAVGHETDTSLCDLAADLRAATPSHAAQLAVPDAAEYRQQVQHLAARLEQALARQLQQKAAALQALQARPALAAAPLLLEPAARRLAQLAERLPQAAGAAWAAKQQELARQRAALLLLDPLATLARGYALAERQDGTLARDAAALYPGERLRLRLAQGEVAVRVVAQEEE